MEIDEISKYDRYEYRQECSVCKSTKTILTQNDSFPEYHTQIYLQCECGNYLEFRLPVN